VFVSSGLLFKSHKPPYRNNDYVPLHHEGGSLHKAKHVRSLNEGDKWTFAHTSLFHVLTHLSITYIVFTMGQTFLSSGYLPPISASIFHSPWLASQDCISLSALTFRPDGSHVFLPDEAYDLLPDINYDFSYDLGDDFTLDLGNNKPWTSRTCTWSSSKISVSPSTSALTILGVVILCGPDESRLWTT
jgi:hypothetical protein